MSCWLICWRPLPVDAVKKCAASISQQPMSKCIRISYQVATVGTRPTISYDWLAPGQCSFAAACTSDRRKFVPVGVSDDEAAFNRPPLGRFTDGSADSLLSIHMATQRQAAGVAFVLLVTVSETQWSHVGLPQPASIVLVSCGHPMRNEVRLRQWLLKYGFGVDRGSCGIVV